MMGTYPGSEGSDGSGPNYADMYAGASPDNYVLFSNMEEEIRSLAAQLEAKEEERKALRIDKRRLKRDNASLVAQNLALRSRVSILATQLKAAQKVVEAARELDWDSYAEEQGKPEVDLSGLWDSLVAYDEQVKP